MLHNQELEFVQFEARVVIGRSAFGGEYLDIIFLVKRKDMII